MSCIRAIETSIIVFTSIVFFAHSYNNWQTKTLNWWKNKYTPNYMNKALACWTKQEVLSSKMSFRFYLHMQTKHIHNLTSFAQRLPPVDIWNTYTYLYIVYIHFNTRYEYNILIISRFNTACYLHLAVKMRALAFRARALYSLWKVQSRAALRTNGIAGDGGAQAAASHISHTCMLTKCVVWWMGCAVAASGAAGAAAKRHGWRLRGAFNL